MVRRPSQDGRNHVNEIARQHSTRRTKAAHFATLCSGVQYRQHPWSRHELKYNDGRDKTAVVLDVQPAIDDMPAP